MPEPLPPPGIDGTYRETCVICLSGTDSLVGLEGEGEFISAVMSKMGMTLEEAADTLSQATGCDPGFVPPGRIKLAVRLCRECARRTGFKTGTLHGSIPYYAQDRHIGDGQHRGMN